jgi:hypothetical protein
LEQFLMKNKVSCMFVQNDKCFVLLKRTIFTTNTTAMLSCLEMQVE